MGKRKGLQDRHRKGSIVLLFLSGFLFLVARITETNFSQCYLLIQNTSLFKNVSCALYDPWNPVSDVIKDNITVIAQISLSF